MRDQLKEHTKPCKPIQKRIFGDKIGDFEPCLMGYMGAEVIACLTDLSLRLTKSEQRKVVCKRHSAPARGV